MIVGLYQSSPTFGDVKRNVGDAIEALSRASMDLVVLPELFNTGYQFISREEVASLAEREKRRFILSSEWLNETMISFTTLQFWSDPTDS